ncbi:hypothetical protein ACFRCW_23740 [Streptomyces sp. NPDC056653]|uniref:hypothetical protein n=1 Tax=Streptomyces sp. NPDC056653 TaxID=3345894 RepID=UPI003674ED19
MDGGLTMVRSSRKPRRLVVGDETFLWSVGHHHRTDGGLYQACREVLTIRRSGARGRLLVVFRAGPGRLVPDGLLPSGAVGTAAGSWLNLHEPGTVKALLDEAVSRGWHPDNPPTEQLDGWGLFARAVQAQKRRSASSAPGGRC